MSSALFFARRIEVSKLTIDLRPSERKALKRLAYDERRKVQDQAAHLLRQKLAESGLLVLPAEMGTNAQEADRVAA
jgi:hypothetical protein